MINQKKANLTESQTGTFFDLTQKRLELSDFKNNDKMVAYILDCNVHVVL